MSLVLGGPCYCVFVDVSAYDDGRGHVTPWSIRWEGGKTFDIDYVEEYFPRGSKVTWSRSPLKYDLFKVRIQGQSKRLFSVPDDNPWAENPRRWWVFQPVSKADPEAHGNEPVYFSF